MKKLFITLAGCGSLLTAYSQATATSADYNSTGPRMNAFMTLPNNVEKESVQGRFLEQVWSNGVVRFKNVPTEMKVPVIFDVYSNMLYYLQNGNIMEFVEPVKEFTMEIIQKEDTINYTYRNNYPVIDKNTAETFYEVLTDGKFQLLRCKAKTIHLYKDKEVPEERRDYSKELLYASLPGDKMVLIKKDRKYLLENLPEYATSIQNYMDQKKTKLKTEESLKELFQYLNGQ